MGGVAGERGGRSGERRGGDAGERAGARTRLTRESAATNASPRSGGLLPGERGDEPAEHPWTT